MNEYLHQAHYLGRQLASFEKQSEISKVSGLREYLAEALLATKLNRGGGGFKGDFLRGVRKAQGATRVRSVAEGIGQGAEAGRMAGAIFGTGAGGGLGYLHADPALTGSLLGIPAALAGAALGNLALRPLVAVPGAVLGGIAGLPGVRNLDSVLAAPISKTFSKRAGVREDLIRGILKTRDFAALNSIAEGMGRGAELGRKAGAIGGTVSGLGTGFVHGGLSSEPLLAIPEALLGGVVGNVLGRAPGAVTGGLTGAALGLPGIRRLPRLLSTPVYRGVY